MAETVRRSYKFASYTALMLTGFVCVLITVYELVFSTFEWKSLLLFAILTFIFAFLIIQLRIEHFIYKRVKQVYDNVSLLAGSSLQEEQVTTDMKSLTQKVEKFAENKKLEIEALKIREDYRKEFMGNVSHELKTPLFTVQGYILTLLDGAMDDEMLKEKYLKRADKGVERLIYIVNDLDMITKLEVGNLQLEIQSFNIIQVISSVFDLLEMKADKKNISLTFDNNYNKPIWVKADKERIQQVVTNLVVNSIKYGEQDGTTEISVEDLMENKILVQVTDNGEGFKQEDIPRLFERFFRIDKSGSRKEGGSGLGLSIVKHILEAHKEKIYVESDYGTGSEFSFTLEKGEKPAKIE